MHFSGRPKCLQYPLKTEVSETNTMVANKVNTTYYYWLSWNVNWPVVITK